MTSSRATGSPSGRILIAPMTDADWRRIETVGLDTDASSVRTGT